MVKKIVHAVRLSPDVIAISNELLAKMPLASKSEEKHFIGLDGVKVYTTDLLPIEVEEKPLTATEWYTANGGIRNKATRAWVMTLDSETLSGTGYFFKILKRGRLILEEGKYIKQWRRTVRHSKEIRRGRDLS